MKEQTSGKRSKWLIPAIAAVLLLVLAVVLILVQPGSSQSGGEPFLPQLPEEMKLYWNVQRADYVASGANGYSARSPREDGYYYVRFAVDGEQVELPVADINVATKIDMQDVMGLIFDEENVVIGIRTLKEFTGGVIANRLYVQSVEDGTVTANTNGSFLGHSFTFQVNEDTKIYNAGSDYALVGMPCQISERDEIVAIRDVDGSIAYVYVIPYTVPGDIYWNLFRQYNSESASTSREPDALGFYNFEMAINGEVKTLQTRDVNVASKVDSFPAKCMGLELDEDGYIIDAVGTDQRGCPKPFASWATVMSVSGNEVHAEKLVDANAGTIYDGVMTSDCKIIDVSSAEDYSGAYTQLRRGDQIHGLYDEQGQICYIFIVDRLGDWEVYWNLERKYDSAAGSTTRTPAADGYYYIQVATCGQQMTVRTKSKELASELDSYVAQCFGMELDGDEIIRIHDAHTIHGGGVFGSWYYVDEIDGDDVVVKRIIDGETTLSWQEGVLAEGVEVINVGQNYVNFQGEYTQLQVGDRVHGLKDLDGKVRVLFIVERPVAGPVYWNVTRMYANGASTRERSEDGYFYFTMAANGQQVTLKTKDQSICDEVDSYPAKCMGLKVSGDVILKVFPASYVAGLEGAARSISWVDVTAISGSSFTAIKNEAGHKDDGKVFYDTMASGCKVYDVSGNYQKFCGEETTLQVGDKIHALHDIEGNAKVIYVVERQGGWTMYWNVERKYDSTNKTTTRTPDADGYYHVKLATGGKQVTLKSKNKDLVSELDSYPAQCFGLMVDGDEFTRIGWAEWVHNGNVFGSWYYVDSIAGNQIRVKRIKDGETTLSWQEGVLAEDVEVINVSQNYENYIGEYTQLQVGDRVHCQTDEQGNVRVVFIVERPVAGPVYWNVTRMYANGASTRERAADGYFYFTMAANGQQVILKTKDQSICNEVDSYPAQCMGLKTAGDEILGVYSTSSVAGLSGGTLGLSWVDVTAIDGNGFTAVKNEAGHKNDGKTFQGTLASGYQVYNVSYGYNTFCGEETTLRVGDRIHVLHDDGGQAKVIYVVDCREKDPTPHTGDHCLCAGNASGLGAHTCGILTGWTAVTDDVLETASGGSNRVKFKADGNYYLTADFSKGKILTIMPGQNINLCLNGFKLENTGDWALLIAGSLNITDCKDTGKVIGNSTANGGCGKLLKGSTLNIFGGTFTTGKSATQGGGVFVISKDAASIATGTNPSHLTLYQGTITGGNSGAANGGTIAIWSSGDFHNAFTMYGGTVTGGTTTGKGSAIYADGNGVLNLLGGNVTGGDVAMAEIGDLTLGGKIQVEDLKLSSGQKLQNIGTLETGASVGLTVEEPGIVAQDVNTDLSGFFRANQSGYKVTYHEDGKWLICGDGTEELPTVMRHDDHCVCGANAENVGDHTCTVVTDWIEVTDAVLTPVTGKPNRVQFKEDGYYYLTSDLVSNKALTVMPGQNITLCLNGFKLENTGSSVTYEDWALLTAGNLTVTDCKDTGKVVGSCTSNGGCGKLLKSSTLKIFGGTFTSSKPATGGGGVFVVSMDAAGIGQGTTPSALTLYHGTISGGNTGSANGAGILLWGNSFTMYGGTVTGGTTTGKGSAIYADGNGVLNLLGGSITGGDVAADNMDQLTLGGAVKIEKLSLSAGQKLKNISGLTTGAEIGISMATAGVFAENVTTDISGFFMGIGGTVIYNGDDHTLSLGSVLKSIRMLVAQVNTLAARQKKVLL